MIDDPENVSTFYSTKTLILGLYSASQILFPEYFPGSPVSLPFCYRCTHILSRIRIRDLWDGCLWSKNGLPWAKMSHRSLSLTPYFFNCFSVSAVKKRYSNNSEFNHDSEDTSLCFKQTFPAVDWYKRKFCSNNTLS